MYCSMVGTCSFCVVMLNATPGISSSSTLNSMSALMIPILNPLWVYMCMTQLRAIPTVLLCWLFRCLTMPNCMPRDVVMRNGIWLTYIILMKRLIVWNCSIIAWGTRSTSPSVAVPVLDTVFPFKDPMLVLNIFSAAAMSSRHTGLFGRWLHAVMLWYCLVLGHMMMSCICHACMASL